MELLGGTAPHVNRPHDAFDVGIRLRLFRQGHEQALRLRVFTVALGHAHVQAFARTEEDVAHAAQIGEMPLRRQPHRTDRPQPIRLEAHRRHGSVVRRLDDRHPAGAVRRLYADERHGKPVAVRRRIVDARHVLIDRHGKPFLDGQDHPVARTRRKRRRIEHLVRHRLRFGGAWRVQGDGEFVGTFGIGRVGEAQVGHARLVHGDGRLPCAPRPAVGGDKRRPNALRLNPQVRRLERRTDGKQDYRNHRKLNVMLRPNTVAAVAENLTRRRVATPSMATLQSVAPASPPPSIANGISVSAACV